MVARDGFGLEGEFDNQDASNEDSDGPRLETIATTSNHELHQLRRRPLENFLSRKGVTQAENIIQDKTRILDQRLSALRGTGAFVRLDQAYSAYLGDITVEITVGETSLMLEEPDFAPEWYVPYSL